jgi:PIN domain nuclease of toxin-antitoxin system
VTDAVLDASALLALLRGEAGAERVKSILKNSAMTTINFGEVVGFYARRGASEPEIRSLLHALPVERVAFDEELAYVVGLMLPQTSSAGLSLGDRACLGLAGRLGVKALTADRSWSRIARAVGVEVEVIR